MLGEEGGVVGGIRGEIAVGPASAVFECLREVPVIDGAEGADVGFEESVGEAAVVVDALGVCGAGAGWLDA
jgi:hypothetical protein